MFGNKKRYIKSCILLFPRICLFFLIFVLSSCSLSPRTHKTYHNPYFSIQYPASWRTFASELHVSINGPIEANYVVNLKIDYNLSAGMNLNLFRETVEAQNQLSSLPGFVPISENELEINGHKALQRIIKTNVVLGQKQEIALIVVLSYLVLNDQIGVVITAEIPEIAYLEYNRTVDDMINSFRFK